MHAISSHTNMKVRAHTHLAVTMASPLYLRLEVGGPPPKHTHPLVSKELGDSEICKLFQTSSDILLQDERALCY